LLRNDSVIVENFHGQLKSKVICPDEQCKNVSITFDPFMFLSVPVPTSEQIMIEVTFVSSNREEPLRKYAFKMEEEDTIVQLKASISQKLQVNPTSLLIADVYHNSIFRWMNDRDSIQNIRKSDNIFVYQVEEGYVKMLTIVHRIKDTAKYQGFETAGLPCLVTFNNIDTLTTRQLMELVKTYSQRYKVPTETPFEELVKITHLKHAHQTNGPEINFTEDVPIPLENKEYIVVTWLTRESFDSKCDENIEFVKDQNVGGQTINENVTLKDCLDMYVKEETLKENNEWYCSKCKNFKLATKKFDIWFCPKYLIIHFKRFNVSRGYYNSRKKYNPN